MDKEEILERLRKLHSHFDPDEVIDFAYYSEEVIADILEKCEK